MNLERKYKISKLIPSKLTKKENEVLLYLKNNLSGLHKFVHYVESREAFVSYFFNKEKKCVFCFQPNKYLFTSYEDLTEKLIKEYNVHFWEMEGIIKLLIKEIYNEDVKNLDFYHDRKFTPLLETQYEKYLIENS